MTLQQWAEHGWLRQHATSPDEIEKLLAVVDRDLADACATNISADSRFSIAYSAALNLCTILLHASGYRAERSQGHMRTVMSLPLILGADQTEHAEYLETCRRKRHAAQYEYAGGATAADADELVRLARGLRRKVIVWLRQHHPDLLGD